MTDTSKGPELDLDDAELEAIEKRAEAATPGPWEEHDSHGLCVAAAQGNMVADLDPDSTPRGWRGRADDAYFIASARTDVPRLIRALRATRGRVASLEAELEAEGLKPLLDFEQLSRDWQARAERAEEAHRALLIAMSPGQEERVAAIARAEAAESRVAELEACSFIEQAATEALLTRAERAEAACAQMRAALVGVREPFAATYQDAPLVAEIDAALASDAGKRHAERVRLAEMVVDEARAVKASWGDSVAVSVRGLSVALEALDRHDAQGKETP